MQKIVLITFDLSDFHLGSPLERIVINLHDKVRFELTNKSNRAPERPFAREFVVEFNNSPFNQDGRSGLRQEFRIGTSIMRDVKIIGEATADRPGEYKFSYGTKSGSRWDVEVDPFLIVLPFEFPPQLL